MYALYTRAQKRAIRYTRAALFDNMDLRCPEGALKFRYMPLQTVLTSRSIRTENSRKKKNEERDSQVFLEFF